jgi:hypothetical protein
VRHHGSDRPWRWRVSRQAGIDVDLSAYRQQTYEGDPERNSGSKHSIAGGANFLTVAPSVFHREDVPQEAVLIPNRIHSGKVSFGWEPEQFRIAERHPLGRVVTFQIIEQTVLGKSTDGCDNK